MKMKIPSSCYLPLLTGTSSALSLVCFTSKFAHCEEEQDRKTSSKTLDYIAVFLDAESKQKLLERMNPEHRIQPENLHVTLKFNPTKDEKHSYAPLCGQETKIAVHGFAQDEHAQTAIVSIETKHGQVEQLSANACPHITLSVDGNEGYSAAYSNVLLERLAQTEGLKISESDEGSSIAISAWKGTLDDYNSQLFPYYSPYPESQASIVPVEEPLELTGVICSAQQYDSAQHKCEPSEEENPECGFCLFMRAGPCGEEFKAWEKCLDDCKKNDEDFVATCGSQTLALRDCVDLHPEYYSVLQEDKESDDKPEDTQEPTSEEEQPQDANE